MLPRITSMTLNRRRAVLGFLVAGPFQTPGDARRALLNHSKAPDMTEHALPLTDKQLSIGSIAASAATGASARLATALHRGLDAGLAVSEIKEILVQLYAYAGFPRALNALGEFMKVLDERRGRGIEDVAGVAPGPVPTGERLLEVGTANQTRLSGAPVRGPLFEFAPAIDQFLKTHLFGDIFARDNLDWQSRELATVAALAAMQGVEPQLLAHVRISMNVGLAAGQLRQFAAELATRGDGDAGQRVEAALEKHLAGASQR
jgi:alkylhydroperoxidase/carboxymuconolactone decarboxylase family protein YurZ